MARSVCLLSVSCCCCTAVDCSSCPVWQMHRKTPDPSLLLAFLTQKLLLPGAGREQGQRTPVQRRRALTRQRPVEVQVKRRQLSRPAGYAVDVEIWPATISWGLSLQGFTPSATTTSRSVERGRATQEWSLGRVRKRTQIATSQPQLLFIHRRNAWKQPRGSLTVQWCMQRTMNRNTHSSWR